MRFTNNHRQAVGGEIRRLRLEAGMSLDELATKAGISASHLSRLERGQTLPSFTVMASLAHQLSVSVDTLAAVNARAKAQTEQWREVLSGHGLSPETIEEILGLSLRARNELAGLFGVDVVGEVSAQAA